MIQQQCFYYGEKCQNVTVPKSIQQISIKFELNRNDRLDFCFSSKTVTADSLQMFGLTTMPLNTIAADTNVSYLKYVALNNAYFKVKQYL